jgi:hypothetical protein
MISMVEVVRRCKHCNRKMPVTPESYVANPYCDVCFAERVEKMRAEVGPTVIRRVGHYLEVIPTTQRGF